MSARTRIPRNNDEARKSAESAVQQWNALYPHGTPVRVYRLWGCEDTAVNTRTCGEAWVAGGISAVIMVEGLKERKTLTHVKPLHGSSVSPLHPVVTGMEVASRS